MKRLLQLFLAGVFLISFTAHARVILPKGGEQWSVGSSVQLQWDATGDTVDIQLIRQGKDPIVIAENVADTGHYLWPIEELETARDYKIEITQGAKTLTSRPFRITAWDAKRYLGEFDENDRSRVTHPRQAAVLDKGNPTVTVNWVDYRHFLKNKVRISLHEVGKLRALGTQTQLDNIGSVDWQLDKSAIKDCTEGLCYFVVRSGRKRNHLITSHSFTLGDVGDGGGIEITEADVGPSEDSAAAGSVLTLGWTGPEGEIRIDLYQAGYYHQTIKEEAFSPDDEGKSHLSWPIPAPLPGGEDYTVVLTSLADGAKQATSTPFSIEAAEDSVTVNSPKDITLTKAAKRARLGWKNTQGPVDIDLYLDGRRVKTIARNTSPNRVHNWPLPGVLAGSDQYTVRVSQADDEGVFGVSALFSITPPGGGAVTQAPSAKRCQALGLAEGCTAGEATVARLALERDCVTWRLYGTACTKKAVEGVIEKLLARADDRPKECQAGWIQIGNQCRPEADCPGLALRDEERPQWLRDSREGEKKGRRRCDQNLLKIENSVDLTIAELMNMWNRLLETKDGDFSELMDDFYAAIHKQDSDNREFKPYRTCRSKDYYRQEVFDYTLDKERRLCKTEDPNDLIHEDFETRRSSCDTEKELKKDRLESEYFQTRLQSPCDPWVRKLSFLMKLTWSLGGMGESFSKFFPRDFQMRLPSETFFAHVTNHIKSIAHSGGDFQHAWESSTKGMLYWPAHAVVSESAESALPPAARIHARFLRLVAEYQKTRARAGEPWYDGFVSKSDAGSRKRRGWVKWPGFSRHFKRAGFRKVEDCNEYRDDRCGYDQGMDRIPKEILWPGQSKLFGDEWPELTDFIGSRFGSDEFEIKEILAGLDEAQLEKIRQLINAHSHGTPILRKIDDGIHLDFSLSYYEKILRRGFGKSGLVVWEGEQLGYARTDAKDDKSGRPWITTTETGLKIIPPAGMDHIYLFVGELGLYNIDPAANFSSRLYPLEAPKPVADSVWGSAVGPFSQHVEANREWLDQGLSDGEKISAKLIEWAKAKEERRSYGIDNYGQSSGFIADPTSAELIPKYLDSVLAAKSRSVLSCPAGYGVEEGACKQCAPGYFKPYTEVNSGPCQMCTGNVIAKGQGSTSCEVCPFGQVPNRDYTACMSNPCTGKNQYWDLATRRCEKSARKRHKWAYMDLVGFSPPWKLGLAQQQSIRYANQQIRDMLTSRPTSSGYSNDILWNEQTSEFVSCVGMCERRDLLFQRCTNGAFEGGLTGPALDSEAMGDGQRGEIYPRPICQSVSIRSKDKVLNASHRLLESGEMTNVLRNLLRSSLAQLDVSMAESGQREKGILTLNVDGHGNGFEAADIKMTDLRRIIREELGDGRLNLVTYNSCLMANYESLAMLEGVTDWVVGSNTVIDTNTWHAFVPFDLIFAGGATTGRSPKEHIRWFMEELVFNNRPLGYVGPAQDRTTFRGYDMDHFSEFREAFDTVLNRLAHFLDTETPGYLERLEVLYTSHFNPHYRYDTESFLRVFEKDQDDQLRKNSAKALKKLNDLAFASSGGGGKRGRSNTMGKNTSDYFRSDIKDKLPFFWTAPRTGYPAKNLYEYGNLVKKDDPGGYPLNPQGNLNPGWEPLKALIKFNQAWESKTRVRRDEYGQNWMSKTGEITIDNFSYTFHTNHANYCNRVYFIDRTWKLGKAYAGQTCLSPLEVEALILEGK